MKWATVFGLTWTVAGVGATMKRFSSSLLALLDDFITDSYY